MRPRYILSAVSACSESRDSILNSGIVTSGFTLFPVVLVAWQRDRDILVQRLEFAYSHVTNVTKVGVVAQIGPPSFSGVIFAPIANSYWSQREAELSETINCMRMRPQYTWSAVSACSESRDSVLDSGMVTSGCTSFPVVLVALQRDRDILVQRLEFAYSHVTNVTKVGVVAQNRSPSVSGVIFAPIANSHWSQRQAELSETINCTRMRPRYTWSAVSACSESRDGILNSDVVISVFTLFPVVLVVWQQDRDILVQRLEFAYTHVTNVTKVVVVAQIRPPSVSGVIFAVIANSHWSQRQAELSETINRTRMRPRYTWSAVSACS